MSRPEEPGERVNRYLIRLLSDEYGADVVYHYSPAPGEFDKPALGVEMKDDTYDRLGWAVCHAVVRGAFRRKADADNYHQAADTLRHVVETIREGVRRGLPVVDGEGPPWYDVAVGGIRIHLEPNIVTFDVRCDFSTGLAPAEVT